LCTRRVAAARVAMVFFVAALVGMPPIVAPPCLQPVLLAIHGLGRHVSIAARDGETQFAALAERRSSLIFGAPISTGLLTFCLASGAGVR